MVQYELPSPVANRNTANIRLFPHEFSAKQEEIFSESGKQPVNYQQKREEAYPNYLTEFHQVLEE